MTMQSNPAAFPNSHDNGWQEGMSLRDYFAGQACSLTWQQANVMANIGRLDEKRVANVAAGMAYLYADAMLAARAESPSK
jgi:hypothetical protein